VAMGALWVGVSVIVSVVCMVIGSQLKKYKI